MAELQRILEKQFGNVSRLILQKLIEKKLKAAGIDRKSDLVDRLVDHVLSGSTKTFQWDDGSNIKSDVTLSILKEDILEIEEAKSKLLAATPHIVESVSEDIAKGLLKSLKGNWAKEHSLQVEDVLGFRTRLERRWGKALGMLRMLLTICREFGSEIAKATRSDQSDLRNVLTRLHVRACQVTSEIILLLENGYADGAMARWRTLHEISVVMILMNEHGEELAKRYLAHRIVEEKTGKDQYARYCEQLGYQPLSATDCQEIDEAYDRAIGKYGKEFGAPYGWAAGYVNVPKGRRGPRLGELEAAAGRAVMSPFYKLASYNVHAGPHALYFRLGLLGETGLLAGASNAGLTEPGQNTAFSLTLISILLVGDSVNLDHLVTMNLLQLLRDEIPRAFFKADRKLQVDHERHSRTKKDGE